MPNKAFIKDLEKLILLAKKTAKKAYAPYSQFQVGCVIQFQNKETVIGFNVENAVYGESVCAERIALFTGLTKGYNKEDFQTMIIFNDRKKIITPCGSCRQVISELTNKKLKIVMVNNLDQIRVVTIEELLPFFFDKSFF